MLADFRCMTCNHEWSGLQGPSKRPPYSHKTNPDTICPVCGSLYMTWLNYEAMAKARFPVPRG